MSDDATDRRPDGEAPAPGATEGEVATAADATPRDATSEGAGAEEALGRDALFEALWARVLAEWDDDRRHAAALEHAVRTGQLPDLAGRYRAQKDVPGHEERAQKRLDAIVVAAMQMLQATRTERRDRPPWQLTAAVAAVCVTVMLWLAYRLLR